MSTADHIPSSPLELLVGDLGRQTKTLTDYLRSNGLPEPSFQRDASIVVLSADAPEEIQAAREQLMDHALQIFQLVAGPSEYVDNVQINVSASDPMARQALTRRQCEYMEICRWMSHFGIFELVPLDGSISYSELASKASVSELRLKSLARMAMTNHLFDEPAPGFLAHSATSAALVTDNRMSNRRVWQGKIIAPSVASMVKAHQRWPDSTAPNHTAFNAAFDTDLVMYDYISKEPELYLLFGRVMKSASSCPKSSLRYLVDGFAWEGLGKATVVDVIANRPSLFSSSANVLRAGRWKHRAQLCGPGPGLSQAGVHRPRHCACHQRG